MAIIQLGSIITNIKGSIGGTTFSSSRAGTIAKNRVHGKRAVSQNQANALNFSKIVTNGWNALTVAQQNEFNSYAIANPFTDRYGITKMLTGYQWYKQLSFAKYYWQGSNLNAPPSYATPLALPSFTVTLNSSQMLFNWSTPINPAQLFLYFYTSPPIKGNAKLSRGAYRLTDIRSLNYASSFNFTQAWQQAHGISYGALTGIGKFNVNVFVVPINRASYVSGINQSAVGSLSTILSGIGTYAIGSTFIID